MSSSRQLCVAMLVLLTSAAPMRAATEWDEKATQLYNLTKFVEWPASAFASPSGAFVICVLGRDPVGMALTLSAQDRRVGGRAVRVRRFDKAMQPAGCHMLFVAQSHAGALGELTRDAGSMLVVGDTADFAVSGGMVGLVRANGQTRIHLNMPAATKAGLRVSARLAGIAESVIPNRPSR